MFHVKQKTAFSVGVPIVAHQNGKGCHIRLSGNAAYSGFCLILEP